jgi:methylase of polypeptide subunit release factors
MVPLGPRVKGRWPSSPSASQAGAPPYLPSTPAQKPADPPTVSHPPAHAKIDVGNEGLEQVQYFLKTCEPSLGHLFSLFVDLGFKSADILKTVTLNWARNDRLDLLRRLRVPQGLGGGEVSELELIALERRFQTYYLEVVNM